MIKFPTKAHVVRALEFLRILDADGNISLTNMALAGALIRLLAMPSLTVHDLGMFIGALISYQAKRYMTMGTAPTAAADDITELQTAVAQLQTTTTALQLGAQSVRR